MDQEKPWGAGDVVRAWKHEAPAIEGTPIVVVDIPTGVVVRASLVFFAVWIALGAIGAAILFALGVL